MAHGVTLIHEDGTGSELTAATQRPTPTRTRERRGSRAATGTSKHADAINQKLTEGS